MDFWMLMTAKIFKKFQHKANLIFLNGASLKSLFFLELIDIIGLVIS
jgi:hypothetical protein